ncbi:MAG: MFS transporter [Bryobacterales bacterium]|nr:MFS transporter [Bryobacterales bacterium]
MTSSGTIGLVLGSSLAGRGSLIVSGFAIHASLGALFAWSTFFEPLKAAYGWNDAMLLSPYRYALLGFTVGLFVASHYSRRLSPRTLARFGSLLLVAGCLFAAWAGPSASALTVGIGLLGGLGAGFAYIAPISTYRHWLPAGSGLILGVTVLCFAVGSLLAAPLLERILDSQSASPAAGLPSAFLAMALIFLVGVAAMGELLPGTRAWLGPGVFDTLRGEALPPHIARQRAWDRSVMPLLRIWFQWSTFFVGAFAGGATLTGYLPQVTGIPSRDAWLLMGIGVLAMAVANYFGRVLWKRIAHKFSRVSALLIMLLLSTALALYVNGGRVDWSPVLAMLALLGFGTGGFLGLMPQLAAEMVDGKESLPLRFGVMYSAFGLCACAAPYWSLPRNAGTWSSNVFLLSVSAALLLGFLYLLIRPVRTGSCVSQALSRW